MEKDTKAGVEKLVGLFDAGTFSQIAEFVGREDGKLSGTICGCGAVDGRPVCAFAQVADREKGAFDLTAAKKIHELYKMAFNCGMPVVGVFDSIGAYVTDGADAMTAYGMLLADIAKASGCLPQIALIDGVCAGMSAVAAAMFDLTVTIKDKSELFVGAPFLTGNKADSETASANGLSSVTAVDEKDAYAKIRAILALLPLNCNTQPDEIESDDPNRDCNFEGLPTRDAINEICDRNTFIEIGAEYGKGMITGLATLSDCPCGVIANDATVNGGQITACGARKVAKLISLCNCYGLPIFTVVDSEGVAVSAEEEKAPLSAELGKLAMVYASADCPKITAIIGKAYGSAFTLMGSKALGADLVYATENAEISVMNPESAVAFLWNGKIDENTSRDDLVKKWKETEANPKKIAESGAIDGIVPATCLRRSLCGSVNLLTCKKDELKRKHCNLPL